MKIGNYIRMREWSVSNNDYYGEIVLVYDNASHPEPNVQVVFLSGSSRNLDSRCLDLVTDDEYATAQVLES